MKNKKELEPGTFPHNRTLFGLLSDESSICFGKPLKRSGSTFAVFSFFIIFSFSLMADTWTRSSTKTFIFGAKRRWFGAMELWIVLLRLKDRSGAGKTYLSNDGGGFHGRGLGFSEKGVCFLTSVVSMGLPRFPMISHGSPMNPFWKENPIAQGLGT